MPKITVEMQPFTVSSSKGEGYSHKIDPENWSAEYVKYLAEYAVGVIVQRSTAAQTKDSGATDEDREKARKAAVQKILDGTIGRAAGGMSREDAALRDALEAQGFKFARIPTGEKTDKGNEKTKAEPVADAFARFTKELLDKAGLPVNEENTAAVLAKLKETTAYKTAMGDISDDITAHFTKAPETDEAE